MHHEDIDEITTSCLYETFYMTHFAEAFSSLMLPNPCKVKCDLLLQVTSVTFYLHISWDQKRTNVLYHLLVNIYSFLEYTRIDIFKEILAHVIITDHKVALNTTFQHDVK